MTTAGSEPESLATARSDVEECFDRYEAALVDEDLDRLATFFWPDASRFGTDGNQASGAEIDRARRLPQGPKARTLHDPRVRALSSDVVVTETRFTRTLDGSEGRQTQVWVRRSGRWAIVHAHVSMRPGRPG